MQTNAKLLNTFRQYLTDQCEPTEHEQYLRRFKRLYQVMMQGVGALHDDDYAWFTKADYEKLTLADLEWISDQLDMVPNAEHGESEIEVYKTEDIWRNSALMQERNGNVTLSEILQLPAVRTMEEFF